MCEPTPDEIAEDESRHKFAAWWHKWGRYLDPDTSDISWFDKRMELCLFAWRAAWEASKRVTH